MTQVRKVISFGSKFKMCISEQSNCFRTDIRKPGLHPGFGGVDGETLRIILQFLGEKFDYYVPEVEGFGTYYTNGTFTGCDDLMQRKRVDVSFFCCYYDLHEAQIAQPTLGHYDTPVQFITKIPDEAPKFDVLLKTFDSASFIAIGISIFFISFMFYLLTKRKDSFIAHLISRIAELLLQEPFVKMEMTLPLEVLTTFWMVASQFITYFFMAVLLTTLLLPNRKPPIDTIDKLLKVLENKEYRVVTYKNSHFLLHLESSTNERERRIGNIMRQNDWLMVLNRSSIVSVLQNNTALITTPAQKYMLFPTDYPHINSKDTLIHTLHVCVYISNSFPLKDKFKMIMMKMKESGTFVRFTYLNLLNLSVTAFKNFTRETEAPWRPLSQEDLQGPFFLLFIGLFSSFIVFIWEIIIHKINPLFKRKSNLYC